MSHITITQINKRVEKLTHDHNYINELLADMFDGEGHDRPIMMDDVTRLKDVLFNKGYLRDIATSQLESEVCTEPERHGFSKA